MTDLADALRAEPPRAAPTALPGMVRPEKLVAPKKRFTIERLQQAAVWGAGAAGAMLILVLTSQSQVAEDRIALILHRPHGPPTKQFDAQAETARLADALRRLAESDDQIQSRLAAVEQDVHDVTGSINRQIKAADGSHRAEDGPSVLATATVAASVPALADLAPDAAPATIKTASDGAAPSASHPQFGVDIGSGLTIAALRMRWAAIRTAHPQYFDGLEPIVSVKEIPHSNRIELRLVAGPIDQPGAAARLCGELSLLGLYCQPTIFDGQHLAQR